MSKAETSKMADYKELTRPRAEAFEAVVVPRGEQQPAQRLELRETGVTAGHLDLPISPFSPPRDDRLFVDPATMRGRAWLPRYRLAEEMVGSERQYRIRLRNDGTNWRLELTLEQFAASTLGAEAVPEAILPHDIAVQLSFDAGGGTRRTLTFDEVGVPAQSVAAALTLSSLTDRDQLLAALQTPALQARLTVARTFRIAFPERGRAAGGQETDQILRLPHVLRPIDRLRPIDGLRPVPLRPQPMPKPVLKFLHKETSTVRGTSFERYWVSVENWQKFAADLFAKSPNLPPCGNNANAARTWVDLLDGRSDRKFQGYCALSKPENLQKLWFAAKSGAAQPQSVRIRLTDRATRQSVISDPVALVSTAPPEPTFRVVDTGLDHDLEQQPFSFAPALHPYVYDVDGLGDSPSPGAADTLRRHREAFGDLTHSYFQDRQHPTLFYVLPDRFRLARFAGDFRPPRMTLRISQPGDMMDSAQAALDYVIAPYTDPARLAHARESLAQRLALDAAALVFQPLMPGALRYSVRRPTASGAVHEDRIATARMLQEPLFDTLQMPVEEFQAAFEVMRSDSAGSVGGTVSVDIEGHDSEAIPVKFEFTEVDQDTLDIRVFLGGAELLVKIANRIESPVLLDNPSIRISQAGRQTDVRLAGDSLPQMLAPGAEIELTAPVPAGLDMSAITASPLDGFAIDPDAAALLDAIIDTSALEYFRTITVEAVPSTFRVPEDPDQQIFALLASFENGASVTLRADAPIAQVRIDYPFADILLGNPVENTFRYTRTIVRVNGEQTELEEKTGRDDHIFITGAI